MANLILQPPKILLDTNHLVNMSAIRVGKEVRCAAAYQFIYQYILKRHFGIILSMAQLLEWSRGKATAGSARALAAILDPAPNKYMMDDALFVYINELLCECRRAHPDLDLPGMPPVLQPIAVGRAFMWTVGVLFGKAPSLKGAFDVPADVASGSCPLTYSFTGVLRLAEEIRGFHQKCPSLYAEGEQGYSSALEGDIRAFRGRARRSKVRWMVSYLHLDSILQAFNPGVDTNAVLSTLDLHRCPAADLFWRARDKRFRAGFKAKAGEWQDWLLVPNVAYADIALVDGGLREMLVQAKPALVENVFSDPRPASAALRKWC